MNGDRKLFTCGKCGKKFWYWVLDGVAQPKIKCSFCATESYPNGEPPKPPAPAPAPPAPAAPAPPETPAA
jgi:hypothetical protein